MFATIRKELLLLLRDPGGLLLLLIMPAALIVVMALVQDGPYRDYQERKFGILVANQDKGNTGRRIIEGLGSNKGFQPVTTYKNEPVTEATLRSALRKGDYQMGIVIPPDASAAVANMTNKMANQMADAMGLPGGLPTTATRDSVPIKLLFDPTVKPSFRNGLNFALNQYVSQVKTELLLERLGKLNGNNATVHLDQGLRTTLAVQEESLVKGQKINPAMNSVQHNVPAWAIFGMFMIVVPISGNMIRERDEGSALRINLIPNATKWVGIGKIVFYILVCCLQFSVMVLVGLYLLPLFDLPRLQLGRQPLLLLPVVMAVAYVAVSYGYFIGAVFKTANQAMPVGAISIVLLSAMGGVWVPIEILPALMKNAALVSPLHWSMEGINAVLLRNSGLMGIVKPVLLLLGIGTLLNMLPVFMGRK
ncbi:MAG: ABC transporter permease [Edaphocola sp.]